MLIAFLSDIQANREALAACLADAEGAGVERHVFLGDLVGYGADPVWVVETVAAMAGSGAVCVRGNHDYAINHPSRTMNPLAQASIAWTRDQLAEHHRLFLAELPLMIEEDDRLYVHANACEPDSWTYTLSAREARESFRATRQRLTFCGHTHVPALFHETGRMLPQQHVLTDDRPIALLPRRRWLAVLGAVGQPRDHNPFACYGLFDAERGRLTFVRVPYDIDLAARKIRAAGLPEFHAARLSSGI